MVPHDESRLGEQLSPPESNILVLGAIELEQSIVTNAFMFIIAIIFMVALTCFLVSSVETCLEQALGGGLLDLDAFTLAIHDVVFPREIERYVSAFETFTVWNDWGMLVFCALV